jgi:hypothetical protein
MKASQIIQGLADLLSGIEGSEHVIQQPAPVAQSATPVAPTPQIAPIAGAPSPDEVVAKGHTDGEIGVFVPPLQAKIELMKKSVNVDSVYDQGGSEENLTGHGADNQDADDNELDRIKKMAGITPTIMGAEGDEPFDS